MAKKLLLDATSKPKSTYGEFTRGYRSSQNIEDKRDGSGPERVLSSFAEEYSRYQKRMEKLDTTNTGKSRGGGGGTRSSYSDTQTPDDYATSDIGGKMGQTTNDAASATRKVDAEEAIRRTHTERN